MHIRKTYIGSDTRRLLPEKVEFAGVSGDNETATLIFEFPETYADYDKYIEWNIEIPFPDSKKTFKPLYLLTDDSFVIPRRLTKVCNGLDVDFNLVFVKDNTLIEKSLQSTVHFATSANGDATDDETDETSSLYMLITNAHIKAEYSENDVSYRPQITFTALDGSTQTLTLNMPYLNDAGKIPLYFLDKGFVVDIFQIDSESDLTTLSNAHKSDWAITPEQDLFLLIGEDYSDPINWLKVYSRDPSFNSISISNKSTTETLEVLEDAQIRRNLVVDGNINTDSNLNVSQDVSVAGSVTTGTLEALQDVLIGGNAEVGGDLLVNGSINTVIDVHASNDLSSARDTTVGRDLRVDGNASVGGDLLVEGSINTVINVNAQNDLTSVRDVKSGRNLEVEGTTLLKGDVTALSGVNITGDVLIGGNTEIKGDLDVDGSIDTVIDVHASNDLSSGRDVSVGRDLQVEGNARVKGDLDVDGSIDTVINVNAQTDLTAGQDLKATRNLEIGGTSILKGDVLIESDLQVDGDINTLLGGNSPVVTDANGKLTVANISVSDLENLTGIEGNVQLQIDTKEDKINKVNSWAGTPSDVSYPSEKLVKSSLDTKVDKNTAITSDTKCKVTYDAKGLVTGGADLADTDVPPLSTSKIVGLDTTLSGINTTLGTKVDKNNTIVGATKAKITYDSKGLVTAGADLVASDIPNLNASKINAGTLGVDRIPNISANKITSDTLTDARIPSNIERNTNKIQDIQSTIGYTGSDTDYPSVHAVQKYTSGVSTPILEAISDLQDDKADDDKVVHKAGNETITGIKSFENNVNIGTTLVPRELAIKGNLNIGGNIVQNGSAYETHAQHVYTTDDKIIMRDGATAGLLTGETAGLTFKKYDGTNDGELSVDSSGTARVGDVGDLQPILTREEAGDLTSNGLIAWDSSRFKAITRTLTGADIPLATTTSLGGVKDTALNAPGNRWYNHVEADGRLSLIGGDTLSTLVDTTVPAIQSGVSNAVSKSGDTMTGPLHIDADAQHSLTITTSFTYPFRIWDKPLNKGAFTLYRTSDGTNPSIEMFGPNSSQRWVLTDGGIIYHGFHRLYTDPPAGDNTGSLSSCRWVNSRLSTKQDNLTFDSTPVSGSVNPVTSDGIYNALATKQDTITGGATTIATTNLTASRALLSDTNGKVGASAVTATELEYLSGVSSAVQTQLNGKQPNLTFDTTPTASSTNPVTSGGIKTALDDKVSKTDNETISGVKTFTHTPIVNQNYANLILKSKLANSNVLFYNSDSPDRTTLLRSQDDGTSTAYTQIVTTNNRAGKSAEIVVRVNDSDSEGYVTATMRTNPGTYDVITKGYLDTRLTAKQDKLTFDTSPTTGSANPVTSGGVKTALDTKQSNLTFDTAPTASSTNPVTSDGIKVALDTKEPTITGGATTITSANLTGSRALISTSGGKVSTSGTTSTELTYLSGVTSAIQTQLNGKQSTLTFDNTPTTSSTNPVTSGGVKTALDTKQATITGGATTIASANLTASRALISDASGKVGVSAVTSTELGYVSGVSSAVQTQINSTNTAINTHVSDKSNPHEVTKAQVGLGNVSNLAPADLGISTATQTALDGKVSKTGNEEIAGIKTFINGIYNKSTQDIGVAGYNHRVINRLYDVNDEILFDDIITKESNKATGRKTGLKNKDTSGTVFLNQHVEFLYEDRHYREYLIPPNGPWTLYRTLNADGTGYSSTPYRSYAQASNTDILTKGHVADILAPKQDKLTFDSTPTASSTNPVTSGGVYTALQQGATSKYSTTFSGTGSATSFPITHSLNNAYPIVTVWKTSGGATKVVDVEIQSTSVNQITLVFAVAPATTDSFNVRVIS